MCRHHSRERADQPVVGAGILCKDRLEAASIDRDRDVRIGPDETVSREMLAAIGHAGLKQPMHQTPAEHRHDAWVAMKAAVADHAAFAVVQVEHGCKTEIDSARPEFGRQNVPAGHRRLGRPERIRLAHLAERAHGRQPREAIGAETLYATALMVHADQDVRSQRLDLGIQGAHLSAVAPVPREVNHTADQRIGETEAVGGVEFGSRDIDDQRGML